MTSPTATVVGNITYGGRKGPPDQAARRVDLHLKDQHQRMIHTVFDRMPGAGVIVSYPQFKAPWMLDIQKYLTFPRDEVIPTKCIWDYQQALTDTHRAWENFFNEFRTIAARMPGVDAMREYSEATKGNWTKVSPALIAEIGLQPEPKEYIEAAMVGNRWVLGFTDDVPAWAEPLISLRQKRKAMEAVSVGEDAMDGFRSKYGDADVQAVLDDQAEEQGMTGGTVPVRRKKKGTEE